MELPKIYQNENISLDNHDQIVFMSNKNKEVQSPINVNDKINRIFNNRSFFYKENVEIKTKNNTSIKKIIGKTKDYLITMNNELIPIKDIEDIKKIN